MLTGRSFFFGIGVWYLESQTEMQWYRDITTIRRSLNCRSRAGRFNWLHCVVKEEDFDDRVDVKVFGLHDAYHSQNVNKFSVNLSIDVVQWPGNMLVYANIVKKGAPVTVLTVKYTLKNRRRT